MSIMPRVNLEDRLLLEKEMGKQDYTLLVAGSAILRKVPSTSNLIAKLLFWVALGVAIAPFFTNN